MYRERGIMTISRRGAALAALSLLLGATPALAGQAKAPEPASQEMECLAIGIRWSGGTNDIRDIEKTPVPDGYKQLAARDGCEGWSFMRGSLIGWHYRYGSEHSMSLALEYYEANERRNVGRTPNFAHALAEALARIGTGSLPAASTARPGSLRALIEEWRDAVLWGDIRLHAAEFFNSQSLRDKAEDDLLRAIAGYQILARASAVAKGKQQGDLIERLEIGSDELDSVREMQTRMAILKARRSEDPVDVSAASHLVDKGYRKAFSTALDRAERNDYVLCKPSPDSDDHDQESDEIKASCDKDTDQFERDVTRFWIDRAEVDLLMASDPLHFARIQDNGDRAGSYYTPIGENLATIKRPSHFSAFDRANSVISLVAHQGPDETSALTQQAFPFNIAHDQEIDLSLRMAEARLKLGEGLFSGRIPKDAELPAEVGRFPADGTSAAGEQWSEGMQQLVPASLRFLPTEYPSRFRQIAGLYQVLFERTAKLGEDRPALFDREAQAAAYFRQSVAIIDGVGIEADTKP